MKPCLLKLYGSYCLGYHTVHLSVELLPLTKRSVYWLTANSKINTAKPIKHQRVIPCQITEELQDYLLDFYETQCVCSTYGAHHS